MHILLYQKFLLCLKTTINVSVGIDMLLFVQKCANIMDFFMLVVSGVTNCQWCHHYVRGATMMFFNFCA